MKMKPFFTLFPFLIFLFLLSFCHRQTITNNGLNTCTNHSDTTLQISDYSLYTGWGICKSDRKEVVVLRKFIKNNCSFYFTVAPQTLETLIYHSDNLIVNPAPWEIIRARYSTTPYIRALQQAEMNSDTLQDAGLHRFLPSQKGIDLTIDLCPSHRPLDRIVFTDLIDEMGRVEKPVPVSVSITGRWISTHPGDLNWLESLVKAGKLSIVWINHSYNHLTKKNVPLKMNFMLTQGIDVNAEVLKTEIALLQEGIIPSAFFRFPGLISDHDVFYKVTSLGLIPVGSDAWLAKGQWPENGSIVLIHANGNEPLGVRDFIKLLDDKRAEVLSKHWELFDLRESTVDDESK
jgi:hypothetical protein